MRIRVLGAGFYGAHLTRALLRDGHEVECHEVAPHIFAGASGGIPARLHIGCHYPRSRMTRAACQEHVDAFMAEYGFLTRGVPLNLYAIAEHHSLVDFDQYRRTLEGEIEFVTVHDPAEYGLRGVEGAILVGERHILTDQARAFFEAEIGDAVKLNTPPTQGDDPRWDLTIDCTFCANDSAGVDRYEPCLVLLMEGQTDKAVTIMDGPFGSLYPWDEERALSSLSSARFTPFSKDCRTWAEARTLLDGLSRKEVTEQGLRMVNSMAEFYPAIRGYEVVDHRLTIRAMPLSGADTRLVDVARVGERALRVRAGKIDAILHAEQRVKEMIGCPSS